MVKQFVLIIILSAVAVYFMKEFTAVLIFLGHAQTFLVNKINTILPATAIYKLISQAVVVIIVPIIIGFLFAFVYWLFKRKEMPRLMEVVWILWIISLLVFALHK
jgi:hypothetical protein